MEDINKCNEYINFYDAQIKEYSEYIEYYETLLVFSFKKKMTKNSNNM